ncbi:MAG: DUF362 domain-containing protein [Bryobacterales bacterium]|nr:DUF362 domain-containing protein [Bryobacterales bacterium]
MTARRNFLLASALSTLPSAPAAQPAPRPLGIPGPFPGKVIAVHSPSCIAEDKYQQEPVNAMIRRGLQELTGAPHWVDAWRMFVQPGDVVGIKVNPNGMPRVISAPEVLHEVIAGLRQAGVSARDIVVFDRNRAYFVKAGYDKWLPDGVRWAFATDTYDPVQLDMDGYDRDCYAELPVIQPGQDPNDRHFRRSYAARFITREINKLINIPVLKHHQSAGVTLALKNMAYGMANNVARSHQNATLHCTSVFIPAIVDLTPFRQKAVLHILDGVKGVYHGGPSARPGYIWEHKTMYFATDPVAVDKVGWKALDEKRREMGLAPVALSKPDKVSTRLNCQPEHIEIAASLGLGVFDEAKIDLRTIEVA